MPARVQGLIYLLGLNKQTNISTPIGSPTFSRFRKLNMDIHTNQYQTETDEDEIGKGNEFITEVFPTAWDLTGRIEKYGSAEFVTWAWAYALGNVSYGSGIYTIVPIDPGVTLELPYFPVVQQLNEGGSAAIDEMYVGCAVEGVETTYKYGAGRGSVTCRVDFAGSGLMTSPSAVTAPAIQTEHYMLSQSMALTILGEDYAAAATVLEGTIGWKNNLLLGQGFYPGSGVTANGFAGAGPAAVRGRMEIGKRMPTLNFTARLLHTSTEYSKLIGQNTGTIVATLTYDATHTVTWTWEQVSFRAVQRGNTEGILNVTVDTAPQYNSSSGILSIAAQAGLTNIAQ